MLWNGDRDHMPDVLCASCVVSNACLQPIRLVHTRLCPGLDILRQLQSHLRTGTGCMMPASLSICHKETSMKGGLSPLRHRVDAEHPNTFCRRGRFDSACECRQLILD